MKRVLILLCAALICGNAWSQNGSPQEVQDDFRTRWEKVQEKYLKDFRCEREKAERLQYISELFERGKDEFFSQDYPRAIVLFQKVIELEGKEACRKYSSLAEQFLKESAVRLEGHVQRKAREKYQLDFGRLSDGTEKLLEQTGYKPTLTYLEPEPTEEEKQLAELEKQLELQRAEMRAQKEMMELELKQEEIEKQKVIERQRFEERRKEIERDAKVQEKLLVLRRLYREKKYPQAMKVIEEILELDPRQYEALRKKESILAYRRRKELIAKRKQEAQERERKRKEAAERREREAEQRRKEAERRRKEQEEKERQARLQRKIDTLLSKAEELIFQEQYRAAAEELNQVLELDKDNEEALQLLDYIMLKLQEIAEELVPEE
ncbi:MAG: hypothetical protein GF333_03930 [Candidatus Omnitrophica bacterium]|nr:hypothetical protein [Candidatus Omnitrophota bacterium]